MFARFLVQWPFVMSSDYCINAVDLTAQVQGILQPIELVEESDIKDDKVRL